MKKTTIILVLITSLIFDLKAQLNQITTNQVNTLALNDLGNERYISYGEVNNVKSIHYNNLTDNIMHTSTLSSNIIANKITSFGYGKFGIASSNKGLILYSASSNTEYLNIDASIGFTNNCTDVSMLFKSGKNHLVITDSTYIYHYDYFSPSNINLISTSPINHSKRVKSITNDGTDFFYIHGLSTVNNDVNMFKYETTNNYTQVLPYQYYGIANINTVHTLHIHNDMLIVNNSSPSINTAILELNNNNHVKFIDFYNQNGPIAPKTLDSKTDMNGTLWFLLENGNLFKIVTTVNHPTNSNVIVMTGIEYDYTSQFSTINDFGFDFENNLWVATESGLYTDRSLSNTVGVEEKNLSKLIIYPNPSSDVINIQNISKSVSYSISDLLGKEIKRGVTSKSINIVNIPSGVYTLLVDGYGIQKIIKQ